MHSTRLSFWLQWIQNILHLASFPSIFFRPRAVWWVSCRPKLDPTYSHKHGGRAPFSNFHPRRYIQPGRRCMAGVEDLRVGPRHRVAARISCWLKDGLHLSSPVGPTGGPMPGYLIWPIGVSVTHQSVPSAPKLSPASGGCWVSHISYRQKPPLAHFHHRLCVFNVRIMQNRSENIGRLLRF